MSNKSILSKLKWHMKSSVNYQAQHNSFALAQHDREARLRKNLGVIETLKAEQDAKYK